mgnify:CR=1 FL=1
MTSRRFITLAGAFCAVVFSQACISTTFTPASTVTTVAFPPVDASLVRVLPSTPPGSFTDLGEVEAFVTGYYSYKAVLQRIVEVAGEKGANAVVFVRDVSTMAAAGDRDPDSAWHKRSSLVYKAVRLPDPPVPVSSFPPPNPACSGLRFASLARR